MRDIKIVIGANFGDEGKGLMTDYFSNRGSIVVCTNGGAQRGHTVVTPKNQRHVFHHFGSGLLHKSMTYLSEDFIVNPLIYISEIKELYGIMRYNYIPHIMYVNDKCKISTPFDMMANQIIEQSRGENKHGSCGCGIYETIQRYKAGYGVVPLEDVRDYYLEKFDHEGIKLTPEWGSLMKSESNQIIENFKQDLDYFRRTTIIDSDYNILKSCKGSIIFENGQGLLLDKNNKEYFPNLTPTDTGVVGASRIINKLEISNATDVEVCYVTRTYMTRHGVGKFPSECFKDDINPSMYDKTNVPNPHQDKLRYGYLWLNSLRDRCESDLSNLQVESKNIKKSIVFTHCNEYMPEEIRTNIPKIFHDYGIYYSNGETRNDVLKARRCGTRMYVINDDMIR